MTDFKPFADDADLLDTAFAWLTTRARRLTLERDARDAARDDADAAYRHCLDGRRREPDADTPERIAALTAQEERLHEEFSGRRHATRANPTCQRLGLDQVTQAHDLSEAEEVVLLVTVCCAISEEVCNVLWGDLGVGFYGNQTVEALSRMADAQTMAERLRVRRLLGEDGRLVKSGLVTIDFLTHRPTFPDDFLGARLRLTEQAFSILVGEAPAVAPTEG